MSIRVEKKYDVIVVGAGFAGATVANLLAKENKKVLVIEKRSQIGGNMYDYLDTNGVLVHKYGPHIFHTNYKEVKDYLESFTPFVFYQHKVLGNIDGTLVPIPFNFTSLEKLLPDQAKEIEGKLLKKYPNQNRVSILELLNDEDPQIKWFGEYVYEKVFVHYTAKQWGIHPDKVDKSVINRVPVVFGYEDLYFSDKYQCMPKEGFTKIFEGMLKSPNIDILLDTNVVDVIKLENGKIMLNNEEFKGLLLFSGAIDELFNYRFGPLPYRSLNLVFERHDVTYYQPNSVVNYPTSEDFTRISEFKYLAGQNIPGHTTILKEYSLTYDKDNPIASTPYYPIQNPENIALYNQYRDLLKDYPQVYLCGRLAEYKYYNMDVVILKAFEVAEEMKKHLK